MGSHVSVHYSDPNWIYEMEDLRVRAYNASDMTSVYRIEAEVQRYYPGHRFRSLGSRAHVTVHHSAPPAPVVVHHQPATRVTTTTTRRYGGGFGPSVQVTTQRRTQPTVHVTTQRAQPTYGGHHHVVHHHQPAADPTRTCPLCDGLGGYGMFGPVGMNDPQYKGKCPCCRGKRRISSYAKRCVTCGGKGAFGDHGPCKPHSVHFQYSCRDCDGRCYLE